MPEAQYISTSEFEAFAGDSKYPTKWLKKHQGESLFAGFNAWAAIFGMQWFFFRKLYFQGLLSLLLEFGLPFVIGFTVVTVFGQGQPEVLLIVGSALAARIAIGYWANVSLYSEAVRVIRQVDQMNLDNEAHLKQIRAAGGVSVPSLLLAYAILGMLRLVFPHVW